MKQKRNRDVHRIRALNIDKDPFSSNYPFFPFFKFDSPKIPFFFSVRLSRFKSIYIWVKTITEVRILVIHSAATSVVTFPVIALIYLFCYDTNRVQWYF